MNYQAKKQLLAVLFSIIYFMGGISATICKGKSNAIQTEAPMCITDSSAAKFDEKQSCMKPAAADFKGTCTAEKCSEINIRIKPGTFKDTNDKIWSVVGCFAEDMDFMICAHDPHIASTAAPESTTTANPTTTVTVTTTVKPTTTRGPTSSTESSSTETTMSTTTGTPSSTSTTSGATSSTVTTTAADTTTAAAQPSTAEATSTMGPESSTADPNLPMFAGCLVGILEWAGASCAVVAETSFTGGYHNSTEMGPAYTATVKASVIGCCATDNCEVSDGVTRDNICKIGDKSSSFSGDCESDCYSYVSKTDGVRLGCLTDVDLAGTSFSDVTTCTTYMAGSCTDVDGDYECLRCCSGSNCNTWTTKGDLLDLEEEEEDGAVSVYASISLLVAAVVFSQLY